MNIGIRSILEAGRLAPTAKNEQKNRHIIVTDEELIQQMVDACRGQKWIATAPAVLVECAAQDIKLQRKAWKKSRRSIGCEHP